MKFISAKCPNCNADLQVKDGITNIKCEYCGKNVIIDDESHKIKINGKVSIEGVQTDKELIDNANELLDMGEYIKAKKLFEKFSTNNPNKYQGWLGLLICRTRNFTIKDNNILFENDIEKYYKFFLRTADEETKNTYFEKIDRYMNPQKYIEENTETTNDKNTNNKNVKAKKESTGKSRVTAGLLGIFLGGLGIHNFYLEKNKLAIIQLVVFILSCGISFLWGTIEGIVILAGGINTDGNGNPLV